MSRNSLIDSSKTLNVHKAATNLAQNFKPSANSKLK